MDFLTIGALICVAIGGVAYDTYAHPQTLVATVVQQGDDTGSGMDKALVTGVVQNELDRMARVPSLLAQPHIRPSEERGFVEALGDATGTGPFLDLMTSAFRERADNLNIGAYSDNGKFKVFVYGSAHAVPSRIGRFTITVTQADGESNLETLQRATVAGAERVDPYLAMLFLLSEWERTGDQKYGDAAQAIATYTTQRIPPHVAVLLVARIENVEGLLYLRHGDLDKAVAAFTEGLTHVPQGNIGPTPVILRLNRALIEVARNDTDAAQADLDAITAMTGNFSKLVGINVATTEEEPFSLTAEQVDVLRGTYDTIAAAIALRGKHTDVAEALLKRALAENPNQLTAISLQADIAAIRGDQATEAALRKEVVERSLTMNPELEVALVHATLSFTADTVTLRPPLVMKQ